MAAVAMHAQHLPLCVKWIQERPWVLGDMLCICEPAGTAQQGAVAPQHRESRAPQMLQQLVCLADCCVCMPALSSMHAAI